MNNYEHKHRLFYMWLKQTCKMHPLQLLDMNQVAIRKHPLDRRCPEFHLNISPEHFQLYYTTLFRMEGMIH